MSERASDTLRASAERYRILFQQAPVGVFIYDRELVLTEFNDRFVETLQSTREKLLGLDMRTLRDTRILPPLEAVLLGCATTYEGSYAATTSSAQIEVTIRLSPLRAEDGEIVGGMGVVQDVTAQRRVERALRSSEARFRTLIENAPDAVIVTRGTTILYANSVIAAYLGFDDSRALVGLNAAAFVHPDELAQRDEAMKRLLVDGAPIVAETRLVRRDGSVLTVDFTSLPIEFDGDPALLSFARDVTERKLMQARLLQADRMASVGTLAAGVAHEINNPLAYLIANVDVLGRRKVGELDAALDRIAEATSRDEIEAGLGAARKVLGQVREMVAIAHEGADRVRSVVRDLKTFSRQDEERHGPIDVREVLDATINMVWNEVRHRAQLRRDYADVPIVHGDESRLGQVFLNLLVNAVQSLPEGDSARHTITVRTYSSDEGHAVVEVSDTGTGIPDEVLPRVFDPFFTTKAAGEGTGLGLWICQGIVSSLGGQIAIESDPGRGTLARVSFPVWARPATIEPARPEASELAPRRARILVVDDEVSLGQILRAELSEHDVVTVTSGREALRLLRDDRRFDVVLCDLLMPDVAGMEVFEELRRKGDDLASRFAFMTGGAFTSGARAFLQTVANPVVEKPFDGDKLRGVIAELMKGAERAA